MRTQRTAAASRRTVIVALTANAIVAVAKIIGGLISGSAALLAEAAHSIADTGNQAFLLVSISLASREPTPDQPFGFGRERFLWTFIAAVAMFIAGAFFAVGYGVYQLVSGGESSGYLAAYVTLGISLLAEGTSWLRARRQVRREAAEAGLPPRTYVRSSRDPNVKMVLFEDTAALIGVAFALTGIVLDQVTGLSVFDPAASIAVGGLLVTVAVWMGHDTSELLIGAAARPDEREALERALTEFPQIDQVVELLTMALGPNSLLVAARIDLSDGLHDGAIEEISDRIEERLRDVVPDVTEVFLDATTAPTRGGVRRQRRQRPTDDGDVSSAECDT